MAAMINLRQCGCHQAIGNLKTGGAPTPGTPAQTPDRVFCFLWELNTHLDWNLSDALGRVCVAQYPSLSAGLRDLLDGLQRPNLAGRNQEAYEREDAFLHWYRFGKTKGVIKDICIGTLLLKGRPVPKPRYDDIVGGRNGSKYLAIII